MNEPAAAEPGVTSIVPSRLRIAAPLSNPWTETTRRAGAASTRTNGDAEGARSLASRVAGSMTVTPLRRTVTVSSTAIGEGAATTWTVTVTTGADAPRGDTWKL